MRTHGVTRRGQTVHALWEEQPGLYRGFLADVTTALVLGAVLAIGGRQHTQATAWDVVNANGGPAAWGLVLLGLGLLLCAAALFSARLVVVLMWVLALYYVIIGLAFAGSVWLDPEQGGSYFGAVLVLRAAFMHVSRAACYREGPRGSWTG